jgi:hypothetical protein
VVIVSGSDTLEFCLAEAALGPALFATQLNDDALAQWPARHREAFLSRAVVFDLGRNMIQ